MDINEGKVAKHLAPIGLVTDCCGLYLWQHSYQFISRVKLGFIKVNTLCKKTSSLVDFIQVYLQCHCSNDIPSVEERLQELLHKESYSSDAQNLVINLNDLCQKIHKVVCDHLRYFLESLIQVSLFLDPRFVSLKHLLDLHSHEYRYTQD
jgi:hypothetical protein